MTWVDNWSGQLVDEILVFDDALVVAGHGGYGRRQPGLVRCEIGEIVRTAL